jgi:hypothetical protein
MKKKYISIYNANNIFTKKIIFKCNDANDNIRIMYSDKYIQPLLIELPYIKINDNFINLQNIIILPMYQKNKNDSNNTLENLFIELDKYILNYLRKNYKKININQNTNNIEYNSILQYVKGDNDNLYKNGIIKLKILENNKTLIYIDKKNNVSTNYEKYIKKNIYIKTIIEINSICIKENKINIIIYLHQAKIKHKKYNKFYLSTYSFVSSEDDKSNDSNSDSNDENKDDNENSIINNNEISNGSEFLSEIIDENVKINNLFKQEIHNITTTSFNDNNNVNDEKNIDGINDIINTNDIINSDDIKTK